MLSVLIVDDSAEKSAKVATCVRHFVSDSELEIREARTLVEARQQLSSHRFDVMILDISIPLRSGEGPRPDGGILLLGELGDSASGLCRPMHIVGLSEFPELVAQHSAEFEDKLWFLIPYEESSRAWMEKLGKKLVHVVESAYAPQHTGYDYDLAIVTALEAIELEAVLRLPGGWREKRWKGEPIIFRVGRFKKGRRSLKIVAAAAGEMGMTAAAILSMKLIDRFRPRVLAMPGIAAGVQGAFGDILVAEQSWDYGSGKRFLDEGSRTSKFGPAPAPIPLHPVLRAKVSRFGLDGEMRARIRASWPGKDPVGPPMIRMGPLASGASVIADRAVINDLLSHNRKVVGVEMEAYGVFLASTSCCDPRPMALVSKSICDFGDVGKDDAYQAYAAHTSARFVYEFALSELLPEIA